MIIFKNISLIFLIDLQIPLLVGSLIGLVLGVLAVVFITKYEKLNWMGVWGIILNIIAALFVMFIVIVH